jgi:hypothetical protein
MVFGGEARGKESTWNTRRRWEDNIKLKRQKVECGIGCTDLA